MFDILVLLWCFTITHSMSQTIPVSLGWSATPLLSMKANRNTLLSLRTLTGAVLVGIDHGSTARNRSVLGHFQSITTDKGLENYGHSIFETTITDCRHCRPSYYVYDTHFYVLAECQVSCVRRESIVEV